MLNVLRELIREVLSILLMVVVAKFVIQVITRGRIFGNHKHLAKMQNFKGYYDYQKYKLRVRHARYYKVKKLLVKTLALLRKTASSLQSKYQRRKWKTANPIVPIWNDVTCMQEDELIGTAVVEEPKIPISFDNSCMQEDALIGTAPENVHYYEYSCL